MTPSSLRSLPRLTPENTPYWTGGERDELLINRCTRCNEWSHPPAPICPSCLSRDVAPQPIDNSATLMSYTINHQRWLPHLEVPYVVGIASLDAAPHIHVMAEVLNGTQLQLREGLPLKVTFVHEADVWIPQFEASSR